MELQNTQQQRKLQLFISQIVLNNFKSYKNQHVINFNPQYFTCITGANGSGKSNILDAILFTLGFRSKYLRQNKLTDLIYNQNGYQADFADVSITFTSQTDQFTIGRQVRLSGASYYYLNNEKCNFDKIEQTLLDHGLDIRHNRFLILQGEVESISMMKPMGEDVMNQMIQQQLMNLQIMQNICAEIQKDFNPFEYDKIYEELEQQCKQYPDSQLVQEFQKIVPLKQIEIQSDAGLLEFIESIVGTQEEIPFIAKQAALVEFINSVMNNTRNSLQQAVQYKNSLDEAKNDAVVEIRSYAKKEQKAMESQMYQASNGRQTCSLLSKENNIIQQKLQQLKDENTEEIVQKIQDFDEQIKQNNEQCKNIDEQKTQIQEQRKQFQLQDAVNQEKISELEQKLKQLLKQSQTIQNKLQKLNLQKEKTPYQQKQIEKELQDFEFQIKQHQEQLKQIQLSNKQSEQEIKIKAEISRQTQFLEKISVERIQYQKQISIYEKSQQQTFNSLLQQLKILFMSLYNIVQISQQKNKEKSKIFASKQNFEKILNSEDKNELEKQNLNLLNQITEIQQQIQEKELKLNEIKSNNQNQSKYMKMYQELINATQHGILKGVYGRVGNLGQIDQKYNLSAVAAFGSQLDLIVCEDMNAIQGALEFLRQNELGTATFLDLSQVNKKYQQFQNLIDQGFIKDNNGILFLQLVKTESKFLPAFWHVMQETVLTDSQENALIINRYNGRQKIRVVTLNGELYEKNGSLTGGNSQELLSLNRGFMLQMQEEQSSVELNQELQKLNKKYQQLQSKQTQISLQINEINNCEQKLNQIYEQIEQEQELQYQNIEILQKSINDIFNIENNIDIKKYGIKVNSVIIEELNQLNQQILSQQIDYDTSIPQIIDLLKYYQQNQLATIKQYDQYVNSFVKKNMLQDLFMDDQKSILCNLLVIDEQNWEQLGMNKLENLKQLIDNSQQKEEQLKIQINELQQKLDDNPEQKLKKQISNCRQQQHKKQQELTDLQVFIQRFDSQIETIQVEQQENTNQQNECNQGIQELQQVKQEIKQQVDQLLAKEQEYQQIIGTYQLNDQKMRYERDTLQKQLDTINSTMNKLQNEQIQNQKQIEMSVQQIVNSEKLIRQYYDDLQNFNKYLQLVEESIDVIQPLYNDHEMQSEIQNYDNYVLANMNSKNLEFNREGDPIALFPNQYQILKEYNSRIGKILDLQESYQKISTDYEQQNNILNQQKQARSDKFNNALTVINQHLRQIYRTFSLGGDAVLEPVDPFDVFQGITLQVLPPKKSWRPVQNLSGGEKTLSSLSLIFSLHFYKQNFLYVVDEIDAALDWRNVQLVAGFMKQLQGCQLIIVSLRNGCFEQADEIVGVWKKNGESQVVQAIM